MRVLLVHNFYQQPGGEDQVFRLEAELLRGAGCEVSTHSVSNDGLERQPPLRLAVQTVWNAAAAREVARAVRETRAQVAHFHNTFPRLSPAVYGSARRAGAATVQTLHNYRLACANALLFRDGRVCEDCLGRWPWPAVAHRCYRGSRGASAAVAATQLTHRWRRTYHRDLDVLIALTEFARAKLGAAGLPKERLSVLPNALAHDPGPGAGDGNFVLFVGRLSAEKGLEVLLSAWERGGLGTLAPLWVVGDGPLAGQIQQAEAGGVGVRWLGRQSGAEVLALMRRARCLVLPSVWYEGLPMTLVEAYACGLPVLASRLGALEGLVRPGRTGALFRSGDALDLGAQLRRLLGGDLSAMRAQARQEYLHYYSGEVHVQQLLDLYRLALERRHPQRAGPPSHHSEAT